MHSFLTLGRRMQQHLLWLFINVSNIQSLNAIVHIKNSIKINLLPSINIMLFGLDMKVLREFYIIIKLHKGKLSTMKIIPVHKNLLESWHIALNSTIYSQNCFEKTHKTEDHTSYSTLKLSIPFYVKYFVSKWFSK